MLHGVIYQKASLLKAANWTQKSPDMIKVWGFVTAVMNIMVYIMRRGIWSAL
jgi:hypothetical protein